MIILGSNSQGRKELLEKITTDFKVIPSNFDEEIIKQKIKKPSYLVKRISLEKLKTLIKYHNKDIILCADTVVYQNRIIYGKPIDREDAFKMLYNLSRKPHYVYSGVAIYKDGKIYNFYDKTKVIFKRISDKEINEYLDTNQYIGKAGSYGIQGIDDKFVKKIVGDIDTVVGMPTKMIEKIINM